MAGQQMPRIETSRLSIEGSADMLDFFVIKLHHPNYEGGEQVLTTLQAGEIEELHILLGAWLNSRRQQQEAQNQ